MAEAERSGVAYQTCVSPPPGDLAVAHPWSNEFTHVVAVSGSALSGLAAVPDAAWATPVGVAPEYVALFSLIDALRTIGEPVEPERIRLAAILVRRPAIATVFMDDLQANEWLRVVGQDARPLRENVIQISQFQSNAVDYPWAEAIKQLKGSDALVTDSSGKWLAGDRLPMWSGQEWVFGRAAVAVQILSSVVPRSWDRVW